MDLQQLKKKEKEKKSNRWTLNKQQTLNKAIIYFIKQRITKELCMTACKF